ncbi:HEPN domain-containing protein [Parafrankia discariae]|uniref:HEPN domain-containing protein n=1 Tax=Parafrankia discariae TaxID=365528 RepID=UPI0009755F1D|nr:HEPN domain-containing protein [Parafrankia discariae]
MAHKQWPPRNLTTIKENLDRLADSVTNRPEERPDDDHIWLTRFLVVRTCGYLEQATFETTRTYVTEKSGGPVQTFAISWLTKSRNPTPDNLIDLVSRFGPQLEENFRTFLEDEDQRLHREISFLVDRRNKIAHGMNEGINTRKALDLKGDAELVADWFITYLNPDRTT